MTEWPESIPKFLHNTALGYERLHALRDSGRINMTIGNAADGARINFDSRWLSEPFDTGEKIKAKRVALDMSQSAVASELDCSPAYISQIEAKESIDRKTDLAFRAIFAAKQVNQE